MPASNVVKELEASTKALSPSPRVKTLQHEGNISSHKIGKILRSRRREPASYHKDESRKFYGNRTTNNYKSILGKYGAFCTTLKMKYMN